MPATPEFLEKYKALNAAQKLAVDTIEGPVMVLAGPGTGKTQTLAMRIANILQQTQMDPWNILCLTFTESGVAAMRQRLLSIVGTPAYYVRIHTFHSFCNEIIQEHPELFAAYSAGSQLSDIEAVELLRLLIDQLPGTSTLKPFGNSYMYLKDISGDIKKIKQEGISPAQFHNLLDSIHKFAKSSKDHAADFFALKPKERTSAVCESFRDAIIADATESGVPASMIETTQHIYDRYELEESTARTAYKSAMKKWYDGVVRQLPKQTDLAAIYDGYQKALKKRNKYDYEDMIMLVIEELSKNSELLSDYQEQFQYILVDEYQDTNGGQNEVVRLLSSFDDAPNVFVVGDDKQSIYRFQGASLANMLDFYNRYKDRMAVISLQENYRSQEYVLTLAGGVIEHNQELISAYVPGIHASLIPKAGRNPQLIEQHVFESEDTEDYAIASHIQNLIKHGAPASDIAVLVRNHRDAEGLLMVMQQLAIPTRLEVGENVFDNICVYQMIELLTYLADMNRDDLLPRILQFDWLTFNQLDVLKIIAYAGRKRVQIFDVLGNKDMLADAGVSGSDVFVAWFEKLVQWNRDAENMVLQDFLHHVFTGSGWLDFITSQDDKLSCLQKMTRLLQEAKQLNESEHALTLKQFLQRLSLLQEHDIALETRPWQTAENAVHIMTAHKAKGLEFEHVVISRLNNKHWGNVRNPQKIPLPQGLIAHDAMMSSDQNEDERRLFYVAATRAQQSLWLTRARHNASGRPTVPSIFLQEIPEEVMTISEHVEDQEQTIQRVIQTTQPIPKIDQDGIKGWLKLLLQDHVLSITHINNYLECPRKFYIKNVLQVPTIRSPHQALGSAVHKALEQLFAQAEKNKTLPLESDAVRYFEKALAREVLTDAQAKDAREVGSSMLQQYYRHYKDDFLKDTKREYNFASHGVVVDDIPLAGLIDKIELIDATDKQSNGLWREGARVHIVDYKTGKPENGIKKLSKTGDYYRQLVFYKLLCDASPRFPFQFASAEIDFVQKSDKKGFVKKHITITDEEVEDLKKEIKRVWKEIQSLSFFEDGAGCGKEDCEYCN